MVQIIAHRGSRLLAPENSLAGYKLAIAKNIDAIDADVVITKDLELVAHHDLYINSDIMCSITDGYNYNIRQTDGQIKPEYLLKNLNYNQLSEYTLQLNRESKYAKWFGSQADIPNLHIPTLQDVVYYVDTISNNMQIQVELKTDFNNPQYGYTPQETASIMHKFIIKHNLINRIKIQSFDWRILYELSALDNRIKTAYLNCKDLQINYNKYFANSKVLDIIVQNNHNLLYAIKALNGYSYEMQDNLLTHDEVILAHKLGLKVIVWGWPENAGFLFSPELVNKLLDWGVDGIITDNLDDIQDVINSRMR